MRLRESHPSFPWFSDGFPFWFPPFLASSRPHPRISLGIYRSQSFFVTYGAPKANPPHPHTILENWVHPIRSSVPPRLLRRPFGYSHRPSFFLFILFMPQSPTDASSLALYIYSPQLPLLHASRSLHCCMLFNSLHGRFAPATTKPDTY